MWIFWLILAGISFLAEILTPGTLVSAWFCLAALIVSPLSLVFDSVFLQILLFAVLALLFLLTLRPVLSRYVLREAEPTNTDRYIGKSAPVTQTILPGQTGYIRLDGIEWSAVSSSPLPIEAGSRVRIEGIDGIKLIVRKEKEYVLQQSESAVRRTDDLINSLDRPHSDHWPESR